MPQTQLWNFAQTPLPSFAELMWRIEDAAKNQTARNPEFTTLDSVERPVGEKEMKIVMRSLDDAGRTTNLYRMMLDTAATAVPTAGCSVERVRHRSPELTVWDIGGEEGR